MAFDGPSTLFFAFLLNRIEKVLGLVGTNGIGKSTALKILAGKLKPNLGRFESPPDWQEILQHFRGSELQNYFTRILEDNLKAIIKPQYVDHIPKAVKGKVGEIFTSKNQLGTMDRVLQEVRVLSAIHSWPGMLRSQPLRKFIVFVSLFKVRGFPSVSFLLNL